MKAVSVKGLQIETSQSLEDLLIAIINISIVYRYVVVETIVVEA